MPNIEISRFDMHNIEISRFDMKNINMQTWLLSINMCGPHFLLFSLTKYRLARLTLVTNVPVPQSIWKHTHDTHTCLIPGNLTVDSLSRSLSIQQFTSVCSFSHALWSLSVGVLPDTVAGAFLPWKENGDSSVFHYMSTLPDYLGSSLPDMAQMSWSTVWVTKSPGCNWILSFSVLVRNTAHFLSKLTTKFSHKMVSVAFWH